MYYKAGSLEACSPRLSNSVPDRVQFLFAENCNG